MAPTKDVGDYTTSAASFGATTSLSALPRHVSQLEKGKLALERDAEMRERYLPKPSPSKAQQGKSNEANESNESNKSLDAVLKPHVSTLERRKQMMDLEVGDEAMRQRYERATGPRRQSALQREVEEASALMEQDVTAEVEEAVVVERGAAEPGEELLEEDRGGRSP